MFHRSTQAQVAKLLRVAKPSSAARNQELPDRLERIAYTGKPSLLSIGLSAHASGMTITFTGQHVSPTLVDKCNRRRGGQPQNYALVFGLS